MLMKTDAVMHGASKSNGDADRLPALDGLRACACLAVMFGHFGHFDVGAMFSMHLLGVAFFFCLSAFLLTRLARIEIERWGHLSIKNFYARRALRIWPLYFTYAAGVTLLISPLLNLPFHYTDATPYWTSYLQNLWTIPTFSVNWAAALNTYGPIRYHVVSEILILWSLSVEEQFYFFFPIVLSFAAVSRRRVVSVIAIALCIAYLSRSMFYMFPNSGFGGMYFATTTYLDVFIAGGIAGWFYQSAPYNKLIRPLLASPWSGWAILAALIGLGAIWKSLPPYNWVAIPLYTGLGVFFALTICWVLENQFSVFPRLCRSWIAVKLGAVSFGMYLWHEYVLHTINAVVGKWIASSPVLGFLLFYGCTALVATLTYLTVEKFFLSKRKQFRTTRANMNKASHSEQQTDRLSSPLQPIFVSHSGARITSGSAPIVASMSRASASSA
jgi:peptidoglycan/LPS O-acetylase OafA/YrhL